MSWGKIILVALCVGVLIWAIPAYIEQRREAHDTGLESGASDKTEGAYRRKSPQEESRSDGNIKKDQKGRTGTLRTRNSAGRSGSYFLPPAYNKTPSPMLVGFHGTGGSGHSIVNMFRQHALDKGFIIIAPDSRKSPQGQYTWEVGDRPGEVTPDYTHSIACINEVKALPDVRIDHDHVLALGYSGGASSAPYIASNEDIFTAFAVLHGGIFIGGIGTNRISGWFSTGNADRLRTPGHVEQAADRMRNTGFGDITFRIFSGGHQPGVKERDAVIEWWLKET